MKRQFIFLSILLVALLSFKTQAQTPKNNKINYVVLTKDIQQLKPISLAAKELAEEDGNRFGEFDVIICGKTVTNLTQKDEISPFLELAEKNHIKLYACGFSLKQFNVDPAELPKQIEVTDNGIQFSFELQKKGYLNIEL